MRMCVIAAAIALVGLMPAIGVVANQAKESRPSGVEAVAPAYPPIAATAGAAGTVTIDVWVRADGTVSSARVVSGVGVLAAAAKNSARRWIFAATEAQASIRVVRLTFVFKIMPSNTPKDELLPIFKPPYQVEVRAIVPEGIDSVNRDPATQAEQSRLSLLRPFDNVDCEQVLFWRVIFDGSALSRPANHPISLSKGFLRSRAHSGTAPARRRGVDNKLRDPC